LYLTVHKFCLSHKDQRTNAVEENNRYLFKKMKHMKTLCRQNVVCFNNKASSTCNNQCVLTGFNVTAKIKADIVMGAWVKHVISLSNSTELRNITFLCVQFVSV